MTAYFCPLADEALLHISGPDSLNFLQGQTTCDTRKITSSQAGLGVYCTPQGRVVCDFLLAQLPGDDCYGLRMRTDITDISATTFSKYIIFSKADIAVSPQWKVLSVWGDTASMALSHVLGQVPKGYMSCVILEDLITVQVDEDGERFELYVKADTLSDVTEKLSPTVESGDPSHWRMGELRSGLARIQTATALEFVPQVLNFDLTGHIAFDKGCYTGQEVVARLHYRGKSKRRLFLVSAEQSDPLKIGADLYTASSARSIGQIVNSSTFGGDCLALVSATIEGASEGLRLTAQDGALLTLLSQPYAVDEPDE